MTTKFSPSLPLILTLLLLPACTNATHWDTPIEEPQPVIVNPEVTTLPENLPPEVETTPLPNGSVIMPADPMEPPAPPPVQADVVVESPAVVALRGQAMEHLRLAQPEQAAASLERAIRIQPNNAALWLDLGAIRFSQQEYVQAEAMSKKAISYANQMQLGKRDLLFEAWTLIANARFARNDTEGAERAEQEAKRHDKSLSNT